MTDPSLASVFKLTMGTRTETGCCPFVLPWGVMPARAENRRGLAFSSLLLTQQHSLCICFLFQIRHRKAKYYSYGSHSTRQSGII